MPPWTRCPWPRSTHTKTPPANPERFNKKQQMRWNRATVQPFPDVRTAVLNGTLEDAFRRRYSGFRPANDDEVNATAA